MRSASVVPTEVKATHRRPTQHHAAHLPLLALKDDLLLSFCNRPTLQTSARIQLEYNDEGAISTMGNDEAKMRHSTHPIPVLDSVETADDCPRSMTETNLGKAQTATPRARRSGGERKLTYRNERRVSSSRDGTWRRIRTNASIKTMLPSLPLPTPTSDCPIPLVVCSIASQRLPVTVLGQLGISVDYGRRVHAARLCTVLCASASRSRTHSTLCLRRYTARRARRVSELHLPSVRSDWTAPAVVNDKESGERTRNEGENIMNVVQQISVLEREEEKSEDVSTMVLRGKKDVRGEERNKENKNEQQ
ncbi:hypothetical protein BDZ97DRAFT_1769362 [Flammula alnicola]|nr:hypothetical protein BDZ97DRAFT_1769362 [Flammula alnicola]